jgi:hypothetical protein
VTILDLGEAENGLGGDQAGVDATAGDVDHLGRFRHREADPDLDEAAVAMSRMAGDPAAAARLGLAGRARMQRQMTNAEFAATVTELLGLR